MPREGWLQPQDNMLQSAPASVVDLLESRSLPELAEAIRGRIQEIMARWEESVRELLPAADRLTFSQLRDDSLAILGQLATALATRWASLRKGPGAVAAASARASGRP